MWGSSIGTTRSSSESIRSSQVLPLRDEPKIQANRPGAVTEMSGVTPSGTLPLFRSGMRFRRVQGRSILLPSDGSAESDPAGPQARQISRTRPIRMQTMPSA